MSISTPLCDWPNCPCERPSRCSLPWRGPAEKARAEREAQQDIIDTYAAENIRAPRVDSPGDAALVAYLTKTGRRARLVKRGVQAVLIGLAFACGLIVASVIGFCTAWYLDGRAIEQAQQTDNGQ